MGTSRNTGSDKQTYYKLTLAGDKPDSVYDMARTLFNGDSMHGDIALIEASLSAQCFYRLVDIGVPFPHNSYGEYVGYKTNHDPRQRATSKGPLTSHYMTNRLQDQVMAKKYKNIRRVPGYQYPNRPGQDPDPWAAHIKPKRPGGSRQQVCGL